MRKQNIDLVFKFKQHPVAIAVPADPEPVPGEDGESSWSYLGYALGGMTLGATVVMMAIEFIKHFS